MDTKLKSTKKQTIIYALYLLIAIFTSTAYLSSLEVKSTVSEIFPSYIYTNSPVASEIDDFTGMVLDYSIFYKNDEYVNDEKNITDFEIESYKQQIQEKIESEYENIRSLKESSESFYNLDGDKQQEILLQERKAIEEKYTVAEDKVVDEILKLKKNAYENLLAQLNSYSNIKYVAYDKLNNIWIGNKDIKGDELKNNSRFYAKRNVTSNNGIAENIYINGRRVNSNAILNRINRLDSGYYTAGTYISSYTQDKGGRFYYKNKYDIDLYIWIPKTLVKGDRVYDVYEAISERNNSIYIKVGILVVSLVILLSLILFLRRINKNKDDSSQINLLIEKIRKWPIEYNLGILLVLYVFSKISIDFYVTSYLSYLTIEKIVTISFIFMALYFIIKALVINFKEGTLLKNNITSKVLDTLRDIMSRGSIIKNIFLSIVVYGVIGFGLLFLALISGGVLFPICFLAGIIITIALIIMAVKRLLYLDKIMVGAKQAAEGKLSCDIEEKGSGLFRGLAHDINNIKEGLRESIKNEMKSERMKSELITNVSHDLKTPLTSIINYIDLLKREELEPETARDYVKILDGKSQRLKTLIEDLFEASKAASGEMKLNIERIDIAQLLKQTLGEFDEKLKECALEVKVNIPDEKIYVHGDGKRLFRVFENLISNITKYSLNNTRVYIDVFNNSGEVFIVMKNISLYELNFDSSEITNRFKRGDEARSTEGSGLGLAIAKSIIELHNGEFTIEVDGDLFKSTIKLGCI